ncbi:MFS polyamine transporter [Sparassis latifolia]
MASPFNTSTLPLAEDSQSIDQKKQGDSNRCSNALLEKRAADANTVEDNPETIVVDWDGPDDLANPRNWSKRRKWAAALTVSAFTFISPVSSSMVAPAANQIAAEFHITSSVEIAMTISVFVLAYAVGPLFLGPLSEMYGRVLILRGSNLFFIAWNLACGFSQNKAQLIAFRFLSGLGGSAPLATGGAVLSDMWTPDQRGQAIAIYSLAPLLGPVIGPVAGGWIAQLSTWRWVFRSTSIAAAVVQLFGYFFLRETNAPLLLARKAKQIKKELDIETGSRTVRTVYQTEDRRWKRLFAKSLFRPFILFAQEPIIQLLGIYLAFVYGTVYLVLTTIPDIFQFTYHEKAGVAGLQYISLGIGLSIASQTNARMLDRVYRRLKERNGGVGLPEFRLPNVMPGTLLLPIGLLIAGWGAEKHVHWILPDIASGFAFIGAGTILIFQGIQTYVIDAFTAHAASALAAVSCLRSLAGFGFPLFAPAMYKALGYGVGDTILAAFALAVGFPAIWLFWKYGARIRGMSKHAR